MKKDANAAFVMQGQMHRENVPMESNYSSGKMKNEKLMKWQIGYGLKMQSFPFLSFCVIPKYVHKYTHLFLFF